MKAIGKLLLGALMLAGATAAVAPTAGAAAYGSYGFSYGYGPGWGRPGPHFSLGYGAGWTRGRWVHGWHGPRYGWWWSVGNSWYLYPRPVYPYPAYLPPPPPPVDDYYAYDRPTPDYTPGSDLNPPPPQYWYFCRNPEGYYPYVQDCDDWQQEAAQGDVPPGDYPEYRDDDFKQDQ